MSAANVSCVSAFGPACWPNLAQSLLSALLLPLRGKFIAFRRWIPSASAFENPQGFSAIRAATPLLDILCRTQGGNLLRPGNVNELVERYALAFRRFARNCRPAGC